MVSEAEWEVLALDQLSFHGWVPIPGPKLSPGADGGRTSWDDIVLRGRTLEALRELNPLTPGEYLEQALAEVLSPKSQDAIAENFRLHEIFVHGYRGISYIDS